jgi:hypothetical protein
MTVAFVLGNGISRQGIDLDELKTHGKIYGCNALYREFSPDVLVATDRPIAGHIQEVGYSKSNRFHTRKPNPGSGALPVPKKYYGYSSGPIAVSLAAEDQHHMIYMLGFDMGPTLNQRFNNIYANTEFYKSSNGTPTFTGNWVKQIKTITGDFPTTHFIRVFGETTSTINDLEKLSNLHNLNLSDFLKRFSLKHCQ